MTPKAFAQSAATLGFAHIALDRLANRRDDLPFLAAQKTHPAARTLAVIGDQVVLKPGPDLWFDLAEAAALGPTAAFAFLGSDARGPAFATLIEGDPERFAASGAELALMNLRQVANDRSIPPSDLGALAEGKALVGWHASHRFCGRCGTETVSAESGWRRECPGCGLHHFPRTDPVVIMLAVDRDRCLLGRQPRFPPGMYSCLAGFLEPGETIEDAVRREIGEEAGIACGEVTYLGSQPWPFPNSLMIGCLVEATSTDIVADQQELEDARWFTRDEVWAMLEHRHPERLACPVPMAIAHHIVKVWAEAGAAR